MNKLEEAHLLAIDANVISYGDLEDTSLPRYNQAKKQAATASAAITKEYAEKFEEWKIREGWNYLYSESIYYRAHDKDRTFSELWDLFLNDNIRRVNAKNCFTLVIFANRTIRTGTWVKNYLRRVIRRHQVVVRTKLPRQSRTRS